MVHGNVYGGLSTRNKGLLSTGSFYTFGGIFEKNCTFGGIFEKNEIEEPFSTSQWK
jgi:hypothetical protein